MHALFFFNDTATTEIYTLSLHDALPICSRSAASASAPVPAVTRSMSSCPSSSASPSRSAEHTSELQSHLNLVCRLLLEKKKPTSRYRCAICAFTDGEPPHTYPAPATTPA